MSFRYRLKTLLVGFCLLSVVGGLFFRYFVKIGELERIKSDLGSLGVDILELDSNDTDASMHIALDGMQINEASLSKAFCILNQCPRPLAVTLRNADAFQSQLIIEESCSTIREIRLFPCDASSQILNWASKHCSLNLLGIYRCSLSEEQFRVISRMTDLKSLYLTDCNITPECYSYIKCLGKLHTLGLKGTPIGDNDLNKITSLVAIQDLDIRGSRVSVNGIGKLKAMSGLSILRADSTQLIQNDIVFLPSSLQLKVIDMEPSKIDVGAYEKLRNIWPNAIIIPDPDYSYSYKQK